MPDTTEVLLPNRLSEDGAMLIAALSSCAIENNRLAIELLETIRRAEADEPVGYRYARRLNEFMRIQAGGGGQR